MTNTDQDLFNNDTPKQGEENNEIRQETPATPSDPFSDKLKEITNENGEPKYKDVATALEALKSSQDFIQRLQDERRLDEQEKKTLKEQLEKMGSIEDFVNRVTPTTPPQDAPKTSENHDVLSEEKLNEKLQSLFNQRETERKQNENLDSVVKKLREVHGDQAQSVIQKVAAELGTDTAAMKKMAMSNPAMALKLLGVSASKTSTTPSQSTISSQHTSATTLERPTVEKGKGAARGGRTDRELTELFRESKKYTNKRLGIE